MVVNIFVLFNSLIKKVLIILYIVFIDILIIIGIDKCVIVLVIGVFFK